MYEESPAPYVTTLVTTDKDSELLVLVQQRLEARAGTEALPDALEKLGGPVTQFSFIKRGHDERRSSSLKELFATIHTILVLVASVSCMCFDTALLRGDVLIHHLATHRTIAHRCILTPVLEVEATTSSRYHPYLPSIESAPDTAWVQPV